MDNKKIGYFLTKRRKALALTQQQLADQIGVSNKAISKWETGEGYPDITSIPELCEALGISADEFFAGEMRQTPGANYIVLDKKPGGRPRGGGMVKTIKEGIGKGFKGPNMYLAAVGMAYFLVVLIEIADISFTLRNFAMGIFVPAVLLACGMHFIIKNPISLMFPALIGLLTVPLAGLLHFDMEQTMILMAIYSTITLIGSSIVTAVKQRYSISVTKKERPVAEGTGMFSPPCN